MKSIIAPVDFSSVTERIILLTAKIASAFSSQVWLLHIENLNAAPADYSAGPESVRDTVADELKSNHRQLQHQAQRLSGLGIAVTPLLIQGETIESIVNYCDKHRADLVIMGTHGQSALRSVLMGSISSGVLNNVACPVLFVRSNNNS
jgi:nucleotide-binding universal stress UspA family protein